MGVTPLVLVAGVTLPLVGDADSAGERHRLIDDHHLAVGPVVGLERAKAVERSEPSQHDPVVVHDVDRGRIHRSGSVCVEQDAHAHTGFRLLGEHLGQMGPDLTPPVDEREEVDRVLGLLDRIEHGREDLATVAERVDSVAFGDRYAEHSLEDPPRPLGRVVRGHARPSAGT